MYKTVQELGRGGFGVVEEVVDDDGTPYARKTFKPAQYIPMNAYDNLRRRFKREVVTQAELGGNEIMPIIEHNLKGDNPWFVMPLAEKTYEAQIQEDRDSGSVEIDAIADILNGLDYLHEHGYVHRDLNPKNILFHEGIWKLSDLGAVLPPSGHTVTLTEGTIIYTEQYCAPEQRKDFHRTQAAADIYSLGCIIHDIFGNPPRTPYSKQTADGQIGLIIEKCTEQNPSRRPSIKVLRGLLLDALIEIGGHCKVSDDQSEEWLEELDNIDDWDDNRYDQFARFFAQLDTSDRVDGHQNTWVYSLSTPFLTRLPREALEKIVARDDGVADAIIEKYCDWAGSTAFLFHFADTVCSRLSAIFDHGNPNHKAMAFAAMVRLGESHNRWYVMRQALRRCSDEALPKEVVRRLGIELKTEELETEFERCIEVIDWDMNLLPSSFRKIVQP